MAKSKSHEKDVIWMSGGYAAKDISLKRAIVREGLSMLTETTIEFQSKNKVLELKDFVGKPMRLHMIDEAKKEREFQGICISVENLGFRDGYGQYVAEVRPWTWLLTRARNCRIFQDKSALEIIEEVFSDHGFSEFQKRLSETYEKRTYCVQYRETDFDFISRLMEEEGIYYYFDSDKAASISEKMVLSDGVNGHSPVSGDATLRYHARDNNDRRRGDHIAEWSEQEQLTTGKVTLTDYDFLSPYADLKVAEVIKKGSHSHNAYEIYDYPGHYRKDTGLGNKRARVRMEAEAITHKRWRGAGSVRTLATGFSFKLKDHPDIKANSDYIITDAVHYLQVDTDYKESDLRHDLKPLNADFPEEAEGDAYACVFGAIPKTEQYRAPLVTPWPEIPGMHTATVVGKAGEEIWTDEHGRIKVQFHWDRVGKRDETSSCWVRVATPWSGKGWGMVAVPRMDQEVVIQFEEGDPDRPICTGMLYNNETMPPYDYPAEQTQLGIKTNSSKGGGGYHELMFDDKKDAELMRVQAQKDHQALIKNKSVVTIGLDDIETGDHDEDGSLSQVVRNHITQTIQEGDHYYTIEKGDEEYKIESGSQLLEIKQDKTQKIEGKHTKTITGNDSTTVTSGNMTVDVSSGKITMTAAMEILLKVGGSSVKIDNSGVTIKGPMIKIEADGMAEVKSPMTTVKGEGMLVLKGGVTMIN